MTGRRRQAFEIVTVGFPFCAFKFLTGIALLPRAPGAAWMLLALGGADALINAVNLGALTLGRAPPLGVCVAQLVARRVRPAWDDLGTSIDVVASFVLVAAGIAFDVFSMLDPWAQRAWSLGVVLNVLGAGFGRLKSSLDALKQAPSR